MMQRSLWRTFKANFAILLVVVFSFATPAFAAEADSTVAPTPSPTPAVGPTGPVGPTKAVGPQGAIGPTGPVGHQNTPVATPTPTPAVATAAASGSGSEADASNGQTGANSQNQNSSTSSNSTTVNQTNNATFNNNVGATATTGGNAVNQNTKVGDVSTGSVNGTINLVNIGNSVLDPGSSIGMQSLNAGSSQNINLAAAGDRSALASGSNSQTGANSQNQNTLQNSNVLQVVRLDQALANNQVTIQADTGHNALNQNTEAGNLKTGDVNLAVNVINLMNLLMPNLDLDIDVWSLLSSNPNATITVPDQSNSQTGADSTNTNSASNTTNTGVTVTRNAQVNNDVTVNASTGDNTVDDNTKVGNVTTGTTRVGGSQVTIANATEPTFYLVNVMGDWTGTLQGLPANSFVVNHLANDQTGADSQNQNTASNTTNNQLSLTQNATANNKLLVNANTGGNTLTQNTQLGDVVTGSISVLANLINVLNSWGGDLTHFHLGIINIFNAPAIAKTDQSDPTDQPLPTNEVLVTNSSEPIALGLGGGGTDPLVTVSVTEGSKLSVPAPAVKKAAAKVDTALNTDSSVPATLAVAKSEAPFEKTLANVGFTQPAATTPDSSSSFPIALSLLGLGGVAWMGTEILNVIAKRRSTK